MATPAPALPAGSVPAVSGNMPIMDEAWKVVHKLRLAISKELEVIQNGGPNTNDPARLEKIEKLMENYRLACIETVWADFRLAKEKKVEDTLWAVHCQVTKAYRRIISKLGSNSQATLRRKLEKLYNTYLTTAQYFYRGWLQRVCARYKMKDLSRVARTAKLEMAVPDAEKIDAKAEQIDGIVKDSCHKTLIYLGDLARYRTLLRTKDRNWDNALAYYLLANDLMPESGFGHHQCGVIYGEMGDHLQVIYHLFRAMDCDKPHPNASPNLEREFRDAAKQKSGGAQNVLVTWFHKLHGFYFHGKEFNERKELEAEVEHRLTVALKSATDSTTSLQLVSMVLANVSSYSVYLRKLQEDYTEDRARSCEFTLIFNLKTIYNISKLLKDEISELLTRDTVSITSGDGQTKYTPTFVRVLPLLRIYMVWLCYYNSQLVELQTTLEPLFGTLCKMLSSTLSLLFELLANSSFRGETVVWRFPEDDMALGCDSLTGAQLPAGCQLQYDAFKKKPKPRREEVPDAAKYSEDDITFTRAMDIILCAMELADKPRFPFGMTKGPKGTSAIVYLENGKPDPAVKAQEGQVQASQPVEATRVDGDSSALQTQKGQTPQSINTVQVATAQPAVSITPSQVPEPVVAPSTSLLGYESNELSENLDFYGDHLRFFNSSRRVAANPSTGNASLSSAPSANAVTGSVPSVKPVPANTSFKARPTATKRTTQPATVSDFPIENQLFNILNDFMSPPELPSGGPQPAVVTPTRPIPQHESSFAMGSAAPGDAFGSSTASPGPSSATGKSFPSLPWNYFYTPAPVDQAMRSPSTGNAAAGWNGALSSRPISSSNASQPAANLGFNNPPVAQQHRYSASGQIYGNQLRQNWQGSGQDGWYEQAGANSNMGNQGRSLANIWAPSANDMWQLGQGNNYSAAAPSNSPFSSFAFSGNTSSLPSVHSPMGLPMRGGQGTAYQQGEAMPSPLSANNPLRAYSGQYTNTPPPGFEHMAPPVQYTGYSAVRQTQGGDHEIAEYEERYAKNQAALNAWVDSTNAQKLVESETAPAANPVQNNPLYGAQAQGATAPSYAAAAVAKQSKSNIPKR
ncbi:hypothetical protein QBC35DRAFT_449361 [Podospora australis]|uniref:Nonsense-mediated mRNA decay factor n=1 Tax=Podospora australis TaxID=1536484 RepID=A0AAN7AKC4_9PEZI|nr:hypothetical protein QBC35DRAFT_449361 [Podospora australis]